MKLVRVTTNGRVSIPAELRKKHGLYPGRKIKFETTRDHVRLIIMPIQEEIKKNAGSLEMKGKLLRALMEGKKSEREL